MKAWIAGPLTAVALAACAGPCPSTRAPERAEAKALLDGALLRRAADHWKAHRIDRKGNLDSLPPDQVRERMHDCKIEKIEATLVLCIDATGTVTKADVLAPSQFPSWDRRLVGSSLGQRYEPYEEAGRPRSICFPKLEVYRQVD